jgi:hypothetical protein
MAWAFSYLFLYDDNCGFVSWVDQEWSDTLKNAQSRLWGLYHSSNTARIDEKNKQAKLEKKNSALLV